jgi:hypothetical protein
MSKIKYTSAFFAVVLVIAVVAGIFQSAVGMEGESDLFKDLKQQVDIYNQNVDEIPFIKSFFGEERINCEISLNDGTELIIGITTDEDVKVIEFEKGEISDPTINASTTESTARNIIDSKDPVSAFQDALNNGEIKFEGVGLGNKIKLGVINIEIKLFGFIGDADTIRAQLQEVMDRRNRILNTLSNIQKKMVETGKTIVRNLR